MKTAKIVKSLSKLFSNDEGKKRGRIKAIESLLDKLEKKDAKYAAKVKDARDKKEREKFQRKQEVCRAQIKKGKKLLKDLKN